MKNIQIYSYYLFFCFHIFSIFSQKSLEIIKPIDSGNKIITNACAEQQTPQWNILIYMDGMEELYSAAFKNITEAMAGYNGDNAKVFIQMHSDSETPYAYRYHLSSGKLIFDTTIRLEQDPIKNIAKSAHWAFKKHSPATYNGLILWNHGFGILDPTWQKEGTTEKFNWLSEPDKFLKRSLQNHREDEHKNHRGIFLDNVAQTYMNNQQMIQTLSYIKQHVLDGKKLDFLGTDTCGMAMLEVAWQIRDFTHYFIGAQNCALKDGWPYEGIIKHFSSTALTPLEAVKMIIKEYSQYYKQTGAEGYTQTAMDLSKIEAVKDKLDQILHHSSHAYDSKTIKTAAYHARKKCPKFCIHPTYTDLWTFYNELSQELNNEQNIKKLLQDGKSLIEEAVVAYTTGKAMTKAHGISIYFPYCHIDSSYLKTNFAQESTWVQFLQACLR